MAWTDKIRAWDYDLVPVYGWLADIVEFHAQRIGWPAYIIIGAIVVMAGWVFKPTRPIISFLLTTVVNTIFSFATNVASLVTVYVLGGLYKLTLASFHRSRHWLRDVLSKRN